MKVLEILHGLLYPYRCPFCNAVLPIETSVNYKFDFDRKYIFKRTCKQCENKFLENPLIKEIKNSLCVAPFPYMGYYKDAVLKVKYFGDKSSVNQVARFLSESIIKVYGKKEFDIITCVPMSVSKKRQRGYNQAEALARAVSKNLEIPYKECLVRTREGLTQHNLSLQARRQNADHAYSAKNNSEIKDKKILIIDDISTTGSTFSDCCRALKEASAKRVLCACACLAIRGEEIDGI